MQVHPQGAEVLVVHVIEPSGFLEQDAGLRDGGLGYGLAACAAAIALKGGSQLSS